MLRTKELVNKIETLRENMNVSQKNADAERKRHDDRLQSLKLEIEEHRKAANAEQESNRQLKRKINALRG